MKLKVEEFPQIRSRIFTDIIACMRPAVESQGTAEGLSPMSIAWIHPAGPCLPGFAGSTMMALTCSEF